jgi:Ca-activated chloride channel family protein
MAARFLCIRQATFFQGGAVMVQNPGSAFLFLLFLPLFWSIGRSLVVGKRLFRSFRDGASPRSLYDVFLIKWFFSSFFLILFLLFTILALMGFTGTGIDSEQFPEKKDVVFAVDLSRSMLASDVVPSRLERTKVLIRTVLDNSSGNRYGLVVFTDLGLVMVPVTEDVQSLVSAVDALSPDLLSSAGTNIAAGISAAGQAFPEGERRQRLIVVFSDGEEHSGDPKEITASLRQDHHITTSVIALGSADGATVPAVDGGVMQDEEGNPVRSKVNTILLQSVAAAGEGSFLDGGDADALKQLRKLLGYKPDSGVRLTRDTLYRPFLALALLFLLLHVLVRMVPWRKK